MVVKNDTIPLGGHGTTLLERPMDCTETCPFPATDSAGVPLMSPISSVFCCGVAGTVLSAR